MQDEEHRGVQDGKRLQYSSLISHSYLYGAKMSTRKRKVNDVTISSGTEFQLHKSQLFPTAINRFIVDFTAVKLVSYISAAQSVEERDVLKQVLHDYKRGKVAVAWRSGRPVWINVTNEMSL